MHHCRPIRLLLTNAPLLVGLLAVPAVLDLTSAAAAQEAGEGWMNGSDLPPEYRDEQQSLVRAAHEDAVTRLLAQIEAEAVSPDLAARQLIDVLGPSGRRELRQFLRQSPQVGGPRLPGPMSAQVQLQASGAEVAGELMRLVEARPEVTLPQGLNKNKLRALLGGWAERTFAATGRSVSPELAEYAVPLLEGVAGPPAPVELGNDKPGAPTAAEVNPPESRLWQQRSGIDEAGRQQAFAAARRDVVEQLMEKARPVVLVEADPAGGVDGGDGVDGVDGRPWTLGDLFDTGTVGERSRRWLASQPVTRIIYGEDRRVEVRLSIEPAAWVEELRQGLEASANGESDAGLPEVSPRRWSDVVAELRRALPEEPSGSAYARPAIGEAEPAPEPTPLLEALGPLTSAVDAAAVPPQWSSRRISAEGSAEGAEAAEAVEVSAAAANIAPRARLRAARAAEEAARNKLRDALMNLPLGEPLTLGEVAKQDPQVLAAVEEAVRRADVTLTIYEPGAGARVHLSADGQDLWQSLLRAAGLAAVTQ